MSKVISVNEVKEKLIAEMKNLCVVYPEDVYQRLFEAKNNEINDRALTALKMLEDNARIAKEKNIPICQDTGMSIVFMHVGYGVCFDGDINKAINEAIATSYENYYLRKSVVDDPVFDRKNTKNNTPAIIYVDYNDTDYVEIEVMAKGFGSENMSAIKMCKPAEGVKGVKDFVIDTVKKAGPNACPPMIVGVGIGGTFDYAARLSKKALLRELDTFNPDSRYRDLENELLEEINKLNIGPLGLKGNTTALKVNIETYPTHIAGMPVAVNICCHASRHIRIQVR
ncbi:MAG: fumarate hydratase [Erysipelotrichaceae bacterium]|nr:fumarate hydratase [Erysipelotrichaceae bacterium]